MDIVLTGLSGYSNETRQRLTNCCVVILKSPSLLGKRNFNYFEMAWNFIEILLAKFHKVSINFTKFHKVSQNHISGRMVVNVDIEFLELNLCIYIL